MYIVLQCNLDYPDLVYLAPWFSGLSQIQQCTCACVMGMTVDIKGCDDFWMNELGAFAGLIMPEMTGYRMLLWFLYWHFWFKDAALCRDILKQERKVNTSVTQTISLIQYYIMRTVDNGVHIIIEVALYFILGISLLIEVDIKFLLLWYMIQEHCMVTIYWPR